MRSRGAVLIVENNQRERLLITSIFQELGEKDDVYAVEDGHEAVDFVKGRGKYANRDEFRFPTFLITDLDMPRMNGMELLLFLKRSRLIIIPIIVFTDSDDQEDINQAYLLGANAYHIKATNLEGMRQQVKRLHEYWMNVDPPAVNRFGQLVPDSRPGKVGSTMRHPVATHQSEDQDLRRPKE